jgi:DNA repair exonuclease SbcCD ATPase subunit
MNILNLSITDLKRISAIEIDPTTGKPVILTGDNGQGKSSVLDGIMLALSNTGLDDPIRHGRPAAQIKLTLGGDKAEYLLERKITKKGSYLTLTDANGIPVQKAQTFLNGLLGNYAFDPLEFTRLKPKDQVEALKVAAGLDFTDLDAKRAEYYAERTTVGRDGKEAAAQLAAVPEPGENVPAEEVSAAELVDNLRGLEERERAVSIADAAVTTAKACHSKACAEVIRLKEALSAAEETASEMKSIMDTRIQELAKAAEQAPTAEQIAAARQSIAQVDETNRAVRSARKHRELSERVTKLRADYATLDRRIEEIDIEKANSVKDARLPVDGLELTDEGVMMNGCFFSQLSTAEQIRISALVAMSQNPGLKIIVIREGALMNAGNLAMLAEMAAEQGYQLWIEKFAEAPSSEGLHIVDGAIAFEDGEPTTPTL